MQTRRATSPTPKRRIFETRYFPRYFYASVHFPRVAGGPLESSCSFTYCMATIQFFCFHNFSSGISPFIVCGFFVCYCLSSPSPMPRLIKILSILFSPRLSRNRNSDLIERGCCRLAYPFLFRNEANPPHPKWYKCFVLF